MTNPTEIRFDEAETGDLGTLGGRISLLIAPDGAMDRMARRVNALSKGALKRLADSETFEKLEEGTGQALFFPAGLAAEAVQVVKLAKRPDIATARKAGAAMAEFQGKADLTVLAGNHARSADIAFGLMLAFYLISIAIERSRLGYRLVAYRESDDAARAIGEGRHWR